MYSKSLLIAIAAFAVTATGAQAFVGMRYLEEAGLTSVQIDALKEANELRREGKQSEAKEVLIEAGIDEEAMDALRKAAHEAKEAMHEAIEANDYAAFKEAVADSPLDDIITSEADFKLFAEAHSLREAGKHDEAKEIFDELGIKGPREMGRGEGPLAELTDEQRDALRAAKSANDEETVKAILKEAGIDEELMSKHHGFGKMLKHGR